MFCAQNWKQDFETNFVSPLKTRDDSYAWANQAWEAYLQKNQKTNKQKKTPTQTCHFLDQKSDWSLWTMLSFFKRIINSVGHCINEVFSLLDPKLYCTKKKKSASTYA